MLETTLCPSVRKAIYAVHDRPKNIDMRPQASDTHLAQSLRFGESVLYTEQHTKRPQNLILNAFQARFPKGTKLLGTFSPLSPVRIMEMVRNQGREIRLRDPESQIEHTITYRKHPELFEKILATNLVLLNRLIDSPQKLLKIIEQWETQAKIKASQEAIAPRRTTFFHASDIDRLNPELIKAFVRRFPAGSRMLAASQWNSPVMVYQVAKNNGRYLALNHPSLPKRERNLLKTDAEHLKELLRLNLPLINEVIDTPEEAYALALERHIDRVYAENQRQNRPEVQYHTIDNKDAIYHPWGFTLEGDLILGMNAFFHPEETLPITRHTGHPPELKTQFVALLPPVLRAPYVDDPANRDMDLMEVMRERLVTAKTRNLRPVVSEGLREKTPFIIVSPDQPDTALTPEEATRLFRLKI